jgi:hypothetical protein
MRKLAYFGPHIVFLIIATSIAFLVIGTTGLFFHWVQRWSPLIGSFTFDSPYSPLAWGTALLVGLLVNRRTRNRSACWVWLLGVGWMGWMIFDALKLFDPRWCQGCSAAQMIWRNFFGLNVSSCTDECLGKLFATFPMFCSIGYSVGAMFGLHLAQKASLSSPK